MKTKVDCFILYDDKDSAEITVSQLTNQHDIGQIFLITTNSRLPQVSGAKIIIVEDFYASATLVEMSKAVKENYFIVYDKPSPLILSYNTISRMLVVADATEADMVYSAIFLLKMIKL